MLQPQEDFRPAQAENYAQYLVPAVAEVWASDILQMAKPRPGDTVLDVGCGTGAVTLRLSRMVGETGKVVGIEANPALLAIAQRVKEALRAYNISFRESEYTTLKYADGVFDRVVCAQEIAFVPDRRASIKEMYRVLSRGGRLVIMSHGTRRGNPQETAIADAFRLHVGLEPTIYSKLFNLGELAGMEILMLEAGLRPHCIIERISRTATFTSFDGFWHGMVQGRSIAQVYETLSRPTQDAIRGEVFTRLAPYRDPKGSGYTIPMEAVIATVLKP
jgi:SAM-dependent methyltransferase